MCPLTKVGAYDASAQAEIIKSDPWQGPFTQTPRRYLSESEPNSILYAEQGHRRCGEAPCPCFRRGRLQVHRIHLWGGKLAAACHYRYGSAANRISLCEPRNVRGSVGLQSDRDGLSRQ